jgi:hypothetical protein
LADKKNLKLGLESCNGFTEPVNDEINNLRHKLLEILESRAIKILIIVIIEPTKQLLVTLRPKHRRLNVNHYENDHQRGS